LSWNHGVPTALQLGPWERQTVSLSLRPDRQAVRLRVGSPTGFRPSEVDSRSKDRRWLGVYVTVGLR
jgi:hypothetical protein